VIVFNLVTQRFESIAVLIQERGVDATQISCPIFSSSDMRRNSLSAHLSASLVGFAEYGLTGCGCLSLGSLALL